MRRLRGDNPATTHDLANAQLYLYKVCDAASTVPFEKVEYHAVSDLEPIRTRLDQRNETPVRMIDDSRIQCPEQQLDLDPIGKRLQQMEQTFESRLNELQQRFSHPEQSPIKKSYSLYNWNEPPNDIPLYKPIPIWLGRTVRNPVHLGLPPLCTNDDFDKLTDRQLADYLDYYKVDVDNPSSRKMNIYYLRCFVYYFSVRVLNVYFCHAALLTFEGFSYCNLNYVVFPPVPVNVMYHYK
ncbi:hypothetical protein EDB19DRAFT_1780551 [Suillus lakei]|nr:hypothetical protein EDB19DRAFT_1780551 [Suillus lakei]